MRTRSLFSPRDDSLSSTKVVDGVFDQGTKNRMPIVDSISRKDGQGSVWPWIFFAVTTTTALMVVRRKIQRRREADAKIDSEARDQGEEQDDNIFERSISYDIMMEPLDKKKVTAVDRLPEMFASTPPHQKKDDDSKDGTEQTESSFCSISSFQSERVEV